jgi:hypothetical protein
MGKYPKAFNHLYTKMVAAGEVGGVLDIILQRLAEFMEKSRAPQAKIKGAMVYPIVVIGIVGADPDRHHDLHHLRSSRRSSPTSAWRCPCSPAG